MRYYKFIQSLSSMSKQKIYFEEHYFETTGCHAPKRYENNINVVHIDGGESQYLALRQMNV